MASPDLPSVIIFICVAGVRSIMKFNCMSVGSLPAVVGGLVYAKGVSIWHDEAGGCLLLHGVEAYHAVVL